MLELSIAELVHRLIPEVECAATLAIDARRSAVYVAEASVAGAAPHGAPSGPAGRCGAALGGPRPRAGAWLVGGGFLRAGAGLALARSLRACCGRPSGRGWGGPRLCAIRARPQCAVRLARAPHGAAEQDEDEACWRRGVTRHVTGRSLRAARCAGPGALHGGEGAPTPPEPPPTAGVLPVWRGHAVLRARRATWHPSATE